MRLPTRARAWIIISRFSQRKLSPLLAKDKGQINDALNYQYIYNDKSVIHGLIGLWSLLMNRLRDSLGLFFLDREEEALWKGMVSAICMFYIRKTISFRFQFFSQRGFKWFPRYDTMQMLSVILCSNNFRNCILFRLNHVWIWSMGIEPEIGIDCESYIDWWYVGWQKKELEI